MKRFSIAAICASSVLTVGTAMMAHETAHVLVGRIAGGSPTLMTATEVLGEFGSLSPAGLAAFGVSGSVINLLLCALGWVILNHRSGGGGLRLSAWFFFAVNGILVTTKMIGEGLAGYGDWMTVLRPFPFTPYSRILVVLLGTAGLVFMVRRSGAALARLVPPGEPSRRRREALRIVLTGAAASTSLTLGGCLGSPVGISRAAFFALGAGLGPFIPMLFAIRFVPRFSPGNAFPHDNREWPWLVAAGVIIALMWFVVGPGIALSGSVS